MLFSFICGQEIVHLCLCLSALGMRFTTRRHTNLRLPLFLPCVIFMIRFYYRGCILHKCCHIYFVLNIFALKNCQICLGKNCQICLLFTASQNLDFTFSCHTKLCRDAQIPWPFPCLLSCLSFWGMEEGI